MRDGQNWSPRFAIYGDLGNTNVTFKSFYSNHKKIFSSIFIYFFFASKAQSLPRLKEDTKLGKYDAIFHIGDFAYDLHDVSFIYFFI